MSKDLNELIVIEPEKALAVFTTDKALEPYLNLVKAEIDKHKPDVSTKKGREAIASLAYKVAQVKSAVDKIGKELKDEQKKIPDLIDSARNYAKTTLQGWQDEVRKPLTEWEAKEEKRISDIKEALGSMEGMAAECVRDWQTMNIADAQDWYKDIGHASMSKDVWQEFTDEAVFTQERALNDIRGAITRRQGYDAEQAELARFRAEQAEREAKEAAEAAIKAQAERDELIRQEAAGKAQREAQAKAEAERQAEADRLAKERQEAADREQKLADEARQAEQNRLDAEQRIKDMEAKAAQELIDSKAREAKAAQDAIDQSNREKEEARRKEAADQAARERNKRHLARINNEAMEGFVVGGMTQECAKLAVTLIAKKVIPNVNIAY